MQDHVTLGVKDFYNFYTVSIQLSKKTEDGPATHTFKRTPCSKEMFKLALGQGFIFLIKNIAIVVLSALGIILTCGCKPSFKDTFHKNVFEARVHAASMSMSFKGVTSPDTINKEFLKLHTEVIAELPVEPKQVLDDCVFHLGGSMELRQRLDLYNEHKKRVAAATPAATPA